MHAPLGCHSQWPQLITSLPAISFSSCTEEIPEGVWSKKADRKVFGQWVSSSALSMTQAGKRFPVKCCAYNSEGTSCETIFLNSTGVQPFAVVINSLCP